MFRNVAFMTPDYTVRVQDGYLIFRWWRTYVPKDALSEDLSHSDTRMSVQLYGFEFHVYNRSKVYRDLEKKFYGESHMFGDDEEGDNGDGADASGDATGSNEKGELAILPPETTTLALTNYIILQLETIHPIGGT